MKSELEAVVSELKQLRSQVFGNNEVVYNYIGRAMSNLIEAKKALTSEE